MYQSQYDGNALFSGGGFMPPQASQPSDSGQSPAKKRGSGGCYPLTVKRVFQAFQEDTSNFIFDGTEVSNVSMVGMLLNKVERVTDVTFVLDDGTGKMDCTRWVNDALESNQMALVQNGTYVRVHGHLKSFQGKWSLTAYHVRTIEDFNEVTYHYLECIYVHKESTKKQSSAAAPVQASMQGGSMAQHPVYNNYSGPASVGGSDQDVVSRVRRMYEDPVVLSIEQGLHVDEVVRRLGLSKKHVLDAIEFLANEGILYSTIDEDHYRSTVNG